MESSMTAKRARPMLSRDAIAAVALRLTLDEPTAPLTLARLGAELGADPTALYRHYRSRDDLMCDLGDRVFAGPNERFRHRDDWRESIVEFALLVRAELLLRPALAAEIGARFTGGPNERRSMELLREVLVRAGLPDEAILTQMRAIGSLVVSHAVMTATLVSLPASALDLDAAIAREIHGDAAEADAQEFENTSFRIIVDTYVDGLASRLGDAAGRTR
jgi:AcrR family transcriptional regulator